MNTVPYTFSLLDLKINTGLIQISGHPIQFRKDFSYIIGSVLPIARLLFTLTVPTSQYGVVHTVVGRDSDKSLMAVFLSSL